MYLQYNKRSRAAGATEVLKLKKESAGGKLEVGKGNGCVSVLGAQSVPHVLLLTYFVWVRLLVAARDPKSSSARRRRRRSGHRGTGCRRCVLYLERSFHLCFIIRFLLPFTAARCLFSESDPIFSWQHVLSYTVVVHFMLCAPWWHGKVPD